MTNGPIAKKRCRCVYILVLPFSLVIYIFRYRWDALESYDREMARGRTVGRLPTAIFDLLHLRVPMGCLRVIRSGDAKRSDGWQTSHRYLWLVTYLITGIMCSSHSKKSLCWHMLNLSDLEQSKI